MADHLVAGQGSCIVEETYLALGSAANSIDVQDETRIALALVGRIDKHIRGADRGTDCRCGVVDKT